MWSSGTIVHDQNIRLAVEDTIERRKVIVMAATIQAGGLTNDSTDSSNLQSIYFNDVPVEIMGIRRKSRSAGLMVTEDVVVSGNTSNPIEAIRECIPHIRHVTRPTPLVESRNSVEITSQKRSYVLAVVDSETWKYFGD